MPLYIPITKIDETTRTVYGTAADETPDKQGEVWDYVSNKPLWEKWSAAAEKATNGKSLGNLRAMHSNIAAGKLSQIDFDDASKSMEIAAQVVDENEWAKVQEGVYQGFSIGGRYVRRWNDPADKTLKRITIDPYEISLADVPCNPSATFTAIKADGLTEQRAFKISERKDVSTSDKKRAEGEYGNVEYADEKNKKYPIDTAAHIRAAWNYIHKQKNKVKYSAADANKIEARIVAAWKKKIDAGGPPSAKAMMAEAGKSMFAVGALAQILDSLRCLQEQSEAERDMEGDDSDVPERFGQAVEMLADVFLDMAEEEIDELLEGIVPDGEPAATAA